MATAALIPARGGSKGLPGKNLLEVGGYSLVARAIRVAQAVEAIDEVFVSSDDPGILEEARRFHAQPLMRDPSHATDDAPTAVVIDAFLGDRPDVEVLVLLQPTSPLRSPDDVKRCLEALERAPVVATVTAASHPAEWLFGLASDGRLDPLLGWEGMVSRRQDGRSVFEVNGAVYVARAGHLREGGALIGPDTIGVQMPRIRSVDIDDQLDLELARLIAARDGDG